MKEKPITPYQRLLTECRQYANKVDSRTRRLMWMYPKDKLANNWNLHMLNERAAAASQLGYVVELEATDAGLKVWYVKKVPERPMVLD